MFFLGILSSVFRSDHLPHNCWSVMNGLCVACSHWFTPLLRWESFLKSLKHIRLHRLNPSEPSLQISDLINAAVRALLVDRLTEGLERTGAPKIYDLIWIVFLRDFLGKKTWQHVQLNPTYGGFLSLFDPGNARRVVDWCSSRITSPKAPFPATDHTSARTSAVVPSKGSSAILSLDR